MTSRLGQQLGNYRLVQLLGEGGFAEVYLGEQILLGTAAAIKVLHTRVTQEEVAQFQQEARLLASLEHPHIVRLLDFGIEGQVPYLIMSYAPNGTLRNHHPRECQLPVTTVVNYVKQVAEALQYAHDRKIIHRDIKPENMLLDDHEHILLSDFGIALIAQSSRYQSPMTVAGTMAYSAPEQIQGKPQAASDQYALGIVAYEWLSGERPFHGSFPELVGQHLTVSPPSLREKLPLLSSDIDYVVLTALAKQPEERFTSVKAFATALELASQDLLPTERMRHVALSPSAPHSSSSSSISPASLHPLPASASPSSQPVGLVQTSTPPTNHFEPLPMPVTLISPALPLSPSPEKIRNNTRLSRRTLLVGAISTAAVVTIGTGIFVLTHQQPSHPTSQNQPYAYRGHSDRVRSVAWSPDGKRITSGSDDMTVQVWNAHDGTNVFTYRAHIGQVDSVAWSPNGQRIASGSSDSTVQVWNASDGSNMLIYKGHFFAVLPVAWSPDGKWIASGSSDRTVQVWNASDGSNVLIYKGHSSIVWSLAWSPDGKQIASGSEDGTVQVWNASDGSPALTYKGHSNWVRAVAWSPDGKQIASAGSDTVQVWNTSDGNPVLTYKGHIFGVYALAWSPDGKRIASGSGDDIGNDMVQVWNAGNGGYVFKYKGHSFGVYALAWSPDGKWIASGSTDKTVQVWQAS